jgi:hypothetical protein
MKNAYNSSVENPEGRLSPRIRGEHNIKMNFKEIGCDYVEWINLTQDRAM